jgi:RNA polymerase sigma-70 factor (ECF subfamily)
MSDTELGRRFASGGEDELEEIINLYGGKLLRYATAILCDYQEAENVVQEVFLAAYQNRAAFDGRNLSAWLYKITYNRSLNQRKKPRPLYFREVRNDEAALPSEDADLSEETLHALRRLKPEDRALLYGRIMEEQSYEQLSHLFERSPAALRKQYERAKKKLAKYLSGQHDGKEQKHEYI